MATGIYFSNTYMRLLEYRQISDKDEESVSAFPYIHLLHSKAFLRVLMTCIGASLLIISLFIIGPTLASPYKWPMWANMAFYGVTRFTFILGAFMCVFSLFMSPNTFVKELMTRPVFKALGSCCFMMALITPQVIELNIAASPDGNYLTSANTTYFGASFIVMIFLASMFFYLTIQWPIQAVTNRFSDKYLAWSGEETLVQSKYEE